MPRRKFNRKYGPAAYRPAVIGIGIRLRSHREKRGISLRPFADKIGLYAQLLSAWEHGTRAPGPADIAFVLGGLGVDRSTSRRVINQAVQVDIPDLADTDPQDHAAICWHYEHLSDRTTVWAPTLIPDLLRTPEHDLSVLNHPLAETNTDTGDAYALAMPQRRNDIADPQRRYTFFIGDTALRACPPSLIHDQINYLHALEQRRNITIFVVPAEVCPPGLIPPFSLFENNRSTLAAAVHHYHASTYITDSDALTRYRRTVARLRQLSTTTVRDAAEQLRRQAAPQDHTVADHGTPPSATAIIKPQPAPVPEPAPSSSALHDSGVDGRPALLLPFHVHAPSMMVLTPGELALGQEVRRLRAARGLARDRLAAAIDVPVSRVATLEHAKTVLTHLADIAALADVLALPRIQVATAALHDFQIHFDLHPTTSQDTSTAVAGTSDSPSLSEWVQAERAARGLTINDLALRTGIPRSTLIQLESDAADLTLHLIVKLADTLRVPRRAPTIMAVSRFPRRPPRGRQPKANR